LILVGGGKRWGNGGGGCIWYKYYLHLYTNGEIIPIETIPGIGEGG
jgi:hypothetical protein